MLEAVPLLAVTTAFIGIFAYSFAQLQLEDIRKNWNERRCEPLVIASAHLVPTKESGEDPSDFAIDNFQFCISKFIDSAIAIFMAPTMKLFSQQITATGPIQESILRLRGVVASLMKPITGMFQALWNKFQVLIFAALRSVIKFLSIFDRIFGVAAASVFMGMSMIKGIQNAIGFVIQVVIAILSILVILAIFLWFIMWPVVPIILTMIGILSATVYSANVSGMAGSFCVAPWTLVATKEGWQRVDELKAGQQLRSGGCVEGILKTTGKNGLCVEYKGVILSASHLVFDPIQERWLPALELKGARPLIRSPDVLYCLNTSQRVWCVKGSADTTAEVLLRDWEELPIDMNLDLAWETLVYEMLNPLEAIKNIPLTPTQQSPGRGLLGKDTYVWEKSKGAIKISEVEIGDFVKGESGRFTEVLGVYVDTSDFVGSAGANSSAWVFNPKSKQWEHPKKTFEVESNVGYHFITKSGVFLIWYSDQSAKVGQLVRDFTEVGWDRIDQTYAFTLSALNT
jgi:hypothetical protein